MLFNSFTDMKGFVKNESVTIKEEFDKSNMFTFFV